MNVDDTADEQVLMLHPRNAASLRASDEQRDDSLPSSTPTGSLVVHSFACTVHTVTTDNIAAVRASTYLLPWRGETVDRYDVRLLLDEQAAAGGGQWQQRSGKRKRPTREGDRQHGEDDEEAEAQSGTDSVDDERAVADEDDRTRQREALLRNECSSGEWQMAELEWERYKDLTDERSEHEMDEDDDGDALISASSAGNRWHYDYSSEQQPSRPQDTGRQAAADKEQPEPWPWFARPSSPPPPPFKPSFPVPPYIPLVWHNTPSTAALHTLIARTAEWCVHNGVQAEVLLKATQANQPAFAFLHSTHALQPYFKHLQATRHPHTTEDTSHEASGGNDEEVEEAAQSPVPAAAVPAAVLSAFNVTGGTAGVAGGPPPGIRRKPALDANTEPAAATVLDNTAIRAVEPFSDKGQQMKRQPTSVADGDVQTREVKQADATVERQLQAAKQRLLAIIAQRAVS